MSKLDREIKAIIDDMGSQAQEVIKKLFAVMVKDDINEDEKMQKIVLELDELKPKTYDVYIADLKQVFREAGWIEPTKKDGTKLKEILQIVRDAGALDDNHGGEDWTLSDSQITKAEAAIRTWAKSQLPEKKQVDATKENLRPLEHVYLGCGQCILDAERNFDNG